MIRGLGGPVDEKAGIDLATRACQKTPLGCAVRAEARLRLGRVGLDHAKGLSTLRDACEKNEAAACGWLALAGLNAIDGAPTDAIAATRGCELNDAPSCFVLGQLHEQGQRGMSRDLDRAKNLYARSCQLGERRACVILHPQLDPNEREATLNADCKRLGKGCFFLAEHLDETTPSAQKKIDDALELSCRPEISAATCLPLAVRLFSGALHARDPARARQMLHAACEADPLQCQRIADDALNPTLQKYPLSPAEVASFAQRACDRAGACSTLATLKATGVDGEHAPSASRALLEKTCAVFSDACALLLARYHHDEKTGDALRKKICTSTPWRCPAPVSKAGASPTAARLSSLESRCVTDGLPRACELLERLSRRPNTLPHALAQRVQEKQCGLGVTRACAQRIEAGGEAPIELACARGDTRACELVSEAYHRIFFSPQAQRHVHDGDEHAPHAPSVERIARAVESLRSACRVGVGDACALLSAARLPPLSHTVEPFGGLSKDSTHDLRHFIDATPRHETAMTSAIRDAERGCELGSGRACAILYVSRRADGEHHDRELAAAALRAACQRSELVACLQLVAEDDEGALAVCEAGQPPTLCQNLAKLIRHKNKTAPKTLTTLEGDILTRACAHFHECRPWLNSALEKTSSDFLPHLTNACAYNVENCLPLAGFIRAGSTRSPEVHAWALERACLFSRAPQSACRQLTEAWAAQPDRLIDVLGLSCLRHGEKTCPRLLEARKNRMSPEDRQWITSEQVCVQKKWGSSEAACDATLRRPSTDLSALCPPPEGDQVQLNAACKRLLFTLFRWGQTPETRPLITPNHMAWLQALCKARPSLTCKVYGELSLRRGDAEEAQVAFAHQCRASHRSTRTSKGNQIRACEPLYRLCVQPHAEAMACVDLADIFDAYEDTDDDKSAIDALHHRACALGRKSPRCAEEKIRGAGAVKALEQTPHLLLPRRSPDRIKHGEVPR